VLVQWEESPGASRRPWSLLCGRNLRVCILAHGFIDTFGLMSLHFGWFA
jgi:hypothetical protein